MLPVRVGINTGDIIETESNAYGCVVNICSRLEAISSPGSVLLTESVMRDLSENQVSKLLLLGHVDFKNIERPMEVYAVNYKDLEVPDQHQFSIDHCGQAMRRKLIQKPLWLWKSVVAALALLLKIDHVIY